MSQPARSAVAARLVLMPPPQQHALGDAVLPADLRGALRAAGDLAHRRQLELPAEDPSLAHCPLLLAQAGECTARTGGVDFHQWVAMWGAVHPSCLHITRTPQCCP